MPPGKALIWTAIGHASQINVRFSISIVWKIFLLSSNLLIYILNLWGLYHSLMSLPQLGYTTVNENLLIKIFSAKKDRVKVRTE